MQDWKILVIFFDVEGSLFPKNNFLMKKKIKKILAHVWISPEP